VQSCFFSFYYFISVVLVCAIINKIIAIQKRR